MSSRGVPSAITLAVIHDGHPVAQPLGFFHVVGGEQDGAAGGLEALDQAPELPPGLGVEPGGGLVEEEELGVADQGAGECQPLLLAA